MAGQLTTNDIVSLTVVEVQKLSLPTEEEKKLDELYLKKDAKSDPALEEKCITIMNAAMSTITVLSFLGGPPGVVIGAGVVLLQSLLPMLGNQKDAMSQFQTALLDTALLGQLDSQMAKMKAVSLWIKLRRAVWDQPDENLNDFKNTDLKYLNDEISPGDSSLFTTVSQLEEKMDWEKPTIRVIVILSYTLLFICYSMICRMHVSIAISAKKAGHDAEVKSHSASYRATLRIFKADLTGKSESYKKAMKALGATRREKLKDVSESYIPMEGGRMPAWWWKDEYNGRFDTLMFSKGFLFFSDGNMQEKKEENEKTFAVYRTGLEDYILRVLKNDLLIVQKWEELAAQAAELLKPAPPIAPPSLSSKLVPVEKLHPLLEGATYVAWSYCLGTTEDGFSKMSPWTRWFKLEQKGGKFSLPKVITKDNDFMAKTQRKVYHVVLQAGENPATKKPGEGIEVEKYVADIFTAEGAHDWIDSEPELLGGK